MTDGQLLLRAVIRTKARETAAKAALADYLLEHLPPRGGLLSIEVRARTRGGELCADWHHLPGLGHLLRLATRRFYREGGEPVARTITTLLDPCRPDFAPSVFCALTVFRS